MTKNKKLGKIEFAPVYFNSTIKTVINIKYGVDKSFQEIFYRIHNWINERSGWIVESADAEYVNISIYSPLSGSTYIKLPCELKNAMKSLINIKGNGNKCFLWCHIRHLIPSKIHPERIIKAYKEMINDLGYEGIELLVPKKDFSKIVSKNNICTNVFCYGNKLTYPVHISDQKFENYLWVYQRLQMKISHIMST